MKCFINKIILCTGLFFFIIDTLCQQDLLKSARPFDNVSDFVVKIYMLNLFGIAQQQIMA